MAALPTAIQMTQPTLSRHERADDIARLKAELNLADLHYVDISAQLELSQALKRWPLLVELARLAEPAQPTVEDERSIIREARS